jgi:hypothetical protein
MNNIFKLTSNGLSVRSNISTKYVLRNASAFIIRIELDLSDMRCIYPISLNENEFSSINWRFNSIRSSCKRGR